MPRPQLAPASQQQGGPQQASSDYNGEIAERTRYRATISRVGSGPQLLIDGRQGEIPFAYRCVKKRPGEPRFLLQVGNRVECRLTKIHPVKAISVKLIRRPNGEAAPPREARQVAPSTPSPPPPLRPAPAPGEQQAQQQQERGAEWSEHGHARPASAPVSLLMSELGPEGIDNSVDSYLDSLGNSARSQDFLGPAPPRAEGRFTASDAHTDGGDSVAGSWHSASNPYGDCTAASLPTASGFYGDADCKQGDLNDASWLYDGPLLLGLRPCGE
eukprot:TRINITY_DN2686_c1_g1_i1.p2 TRINITY_DN2686_c1_g1~~TRINITY_DN2686_c1_g1_i1.p2  ORF type:complete len:298 (+),score=85.87 TRINITY_DN2686_c1_g1_i1:79-894(+)